MESAPVLITVDFEDPVLRARTTPFQPLRWSLSTAFFYLLVGATVTGLVFALNPNATIALRLGSVLIALVMGTFAMVWIGGILSRYELEVDFNTRSIKVRERRMFDKPTYFQGTLDEVQAFELRFGEIGLVWNDPDTPVLTMRPHHAEIWLRLKAAAEAAHVQTRENASDLPFEHTAEPYAIVLTRDSVSLADDIEPLHHWVFRSKKPITVGEVVWALSLSGFLPTARWEMLAPEHLATLGQGKKVDYQVDRTTQFSQGQIVHFRRVDHA